MKTPGVVFCLVVASMAQPAAAIGTTWGDLDVRLNNQVSAGVAIRTESRADDLIGRANGGTVYSTNSDDGNLAFDPGDVVASGLKLTSDLALKYGHYGLFARGSYVFDPTLNDRNYFDDADYGAGKEFGQNERRRKNRIVQNAVGNDGDLLDLYVSGDWEFGRHSVLARIGSQALNWGESTFILNGMNSLLSFDANQLHVPASELDEIIVPVPMAWISIALVENLSAEAFYQLGWRRSAPEAAGTFWSTNDFASIGGTQANLGFGRAGENSPAGTVCTDGSSCVPLGSTVPRASDRTPGADGQFGAAVHWFSPMLHDTDFGFYAANYHSRLPLFSGTSRAGPGASPADTANYFAEYPENIQLYGMSFNTTAGAFALQGEYSLKHDQPLQIDDVELLLAGLGAPSQINPVAGATLGNQYLRGWRRHDVSQVDLGLTRILSPQPLLGYDQLILLGEVAAMHVHNLPPSSTLRYDGPATNTPGDAATAASQGVPQQTAGYATATSWGYRFLARADYNNVIGAISLQPTLRFDHDVHGTAPTPLGGFVEDRKSVTGTLGFIFPSQLRAHLGYTSYFDGGRRNLLRDHDFAEIDISYSF